ncbi:hypothetical protein N7472_005489, partial [Penicillium cf. griseofulvum]
SYPLRNIQVNVTHTDLTLIFAHNYVTSQPRNTSTDLHMNDLSLNFEGLWRYGPVMHKVTKYDLVGRPDYSLWYGYEEDVAEVFSLLVHLFRTAANMSPVQSKKTSVQTHSKESSGFSYMEFDMDVEEDV